VRQVTKSVNPQNHAIWTLERLYQYLCLWAYEVYDTLAHPALNQSPRDAYESGLQLAGARSHRCVQYDEAFRLLTLPTTRTGIAKVIPGKGIKINNRYYWANAFRTAEIENMCAPVRYDPYDAGQAYVFIKGVWVTCHSEHYHVFRGRSEREVMLASSELRKRQSRTRSVFNSSAKKLASFLTSVEAQETLLMQRLRDLETKKVLAEIDGEKTLPHAPLFLVPSGADISPATSESSALTTDHRQPAQFDEPELYSDY
jgi:putative transposase